MVFESSGVEEDVVLEVSKSWGDAAEWAAVWISDSGLMGFLMLPVLVVGNCSGRRWGIDN